MKNSAAVVYLLTILEIILVLLSSIGSIALDDRGAPYVYTTIRGQQTVIYGGDGLYKYDSLDKAAMFKGFDWANIFVSFPLLLLSLIVKMQKTFCGKLVLCGLFTYFAYSYLIGVLGNSYNIMYFVWIGMYTVGLLGVAVTLLAMHRYDVTPYITSFPRKSLAGYMFLLGTMLPVVYTLEIVHAASRSAFPQSLSVYTTLDLAALEIGIMFPLHYIAGILLLMRKKWGLIISSVLTIMASIMFISLSWYQIILYHEYQHGTWLDVMKFLCLAAIPSIFSIIILYKIRDTSVMSGNRGATATSER